MKKTMFLFLLLATVTSSLTACAQAEDKSKRPSPPATMTFNNNGVKVTIDYSQPAVKGRKIFGGLVPYGQAWRTGANEATIFTVNKDVKVEGKPLKAGKYSLFTIPGEKEWQFILNSQTGQWGIKQGGVANRDPANDVLTFTAKPMKAPQFTERMTFKQKGNKIALIWADTEVDFTVQ